MATYRHKTVMRYQVIGGTLAHPRKFQFEDFMLRLKKPEDDTAFRDAIAGLPARELRQIVVVDEAAEARLEKPLSRSIRGLADSSTVPAGVKGGEGLRTIGKEEGLQGGMGAQIPAVPQVPQGGNEQQTNPPPAQPAGGPKLPSGLKLPGA